jgi:TPR repeat protein
MMFMLAETYDPNMLASWQTRGITANPERARALYQKARDLGEGRAQQRLDWLTGN